MSQLCESNYTGCLRMRMREPLRDVMGVDDASACVWAVACIRALMPTYDTYPLSTYQCMCTDMHRHTCIQPIAVWCT